GDTLAWWSVVKIMMALALAGVGLTLSFRGTRLALLPYGAAALLVMGFGAGAWTEVLTWLLTGATVAALLFG
ncbi:MAG TPA: hypothetical protein VNZ52_03810, partial [Candidatus Thermoplasmatota archaeon]|nr:hypothetical protein [Candidatus Thermoplasmatota archaeon]